MAQSTTPRLRFQIHRLRTQPAPQPELGLDAILPEATVQQILTEEGATWKQVLYTPWLTFWTFFWQTLSPDRSAGPLSSGSPPGWDSGVRSSRTRTPVRIARPARACRNRPSVV